MEELIEIRLDKEKFLDDGVSIDEFEKVTSYYLSSYKNAVDFAKENGLWSDLIKKIVVTDNYYEDVEKQGEEWGLTVLFARHKEYHGVSKCLFNKNIKNPEYHIFFQARFVPDEGFWKSLVFPQLIYPHCNKHLPSEFQETRQAEAPLINFFDYLKHLITTVCPAIKSEKITTQLIGSKDPVLTEEELFNFFARQLRRILFDYNSDGESETRLRYFWNSTFIIFGNFLLRTIQSHWQSGLLNFRDRGLNFIVQTLINEIDFLDERFSKSENYSLEAFAQLVLDFFKHFGIEIRDIQEPASFYIHLPKNPKEYFKGILVDTEPRIVCFMDILGFSKMIDEYEENDTSTVLQDIQKAFEQALDILKNSHQYSPNKEQIEFLEYKTFSDNICISLPYFDNETDFLANLNLIITYVRGLQYSLMGLGFFTRGGLSMGSYYSDENMIFSKALVEAYHLESKKAKYPRIIIDGKIIRRLQNCKPENTIYYNLTNAIIIERSNAFLNPFELVATTKGIITNMFKIGKFDSDDQDEDFYEPLRTMTSFLEDITMKQLDIATEGDDSLITKISQTINDQLALYKSDRNTSCKYLWMRLLVEWIENKDKPQKRFRYIQLTETAAE